MHGNSIFLMPDTGVTRCFDGEGQEISRPNPGQDYFGQNGCFPIHPLSFTKLGLQGEELGFGATWQDGYRMVKDNNTGLVWEIKSPHEADPNYCQGTYTWFEAQETYIKHLNELKYGGFQDWRVPNKDELRSIVDYGQLNPAIDTFLFPHCQVAFYWTGQTYEMQPYFGWGIFFGFGSGIAYSKKSKRHVRAVRAGYDHRFGRPDPKRFHDNGDGTITDTVTKLMWQQDENPRMNWVSAMKHCADMKLAGHSDWRLPNLKELNTILNLNYTDNWWYYRDFFPAKDLQPPLLHYFSSTPHENYYIWVTNFCFGYDGYYANRNAPLLHRAVRNVVPVQEISPIFTFPDSGQLLCFDNEGNQISTPGPDQDFYGQDGSFSHHPMSFTKMRHDGRMLDDRAQWEQGYRLVMDNNTGLVWEVKSPHPTDLNFQGHVYTWAEACETFIIRLNQQKYGGYSDWRLPNKEELRTIVNYNGQVPAIDPEYFPECLPAFYWSADIYGADPRLAWGIYFGYGCGICYLKTLPYHVRAVRGGYNSAFGNSARSSFHDNRSGTVSDLNTGLMWKQDESPEMTLKEALHYCHNLDLAGFSDWRMPNIKELPTLLDLSFQNGLWYNPEFFPKVITKPLGFYWSSTTYGESFGWGVNFQFGYDGYYADKKRGKYPFRPVRTITQ
ncbi:DUF1566 domain-containing protein [bacterium]|nr:DUF1566 domain-containing protein [bacterium]